MVLVMLVVMVMLTASFASAQEEQPIEATTSGVNLPDKSTQLPMVEKRRDSASLHQTLAIDTLITIV